MKYKEFVNWCNERACDGCWSIGTAIYCINICKTIDNHMFWKREKIWKEQYESKIVNDIIKIIDKKRKKLDCC